jgi:hypothetical protein
MALACEHHIVDIPALPGNESLVFKPIQGRAPLLCARQDHKKTHGSDIGRPSPRPGNREVGHRRWLAADSPVFLPALFN